MEDEELLDKEVDIMRERSKMTGAIEKPASVRSATPEDDTILREPSQRENTQIDHEVIDEEDNLEAEIDQLVKKKVPRKRKNLRGGKVKNKLDNNPPKRIKPDDVRDLFPHLKIEHDEQRRLAKIASSISGLAY